MDQFSPAVCNNLTPEMIPIFYLADDEVNVTWKIMTKEHAMGDYYGTMLFMPEWNHCDTNDPEDVGYDLTVAREL